MDYDYYDGPYGNDEGWYDEDIHEDYWPDDDLDDWPENDLDDNYPF